MPRKNSITIALAKWSETRAGGPRDVVGFAVRLRRYDGAPLSAMEMYARTRPGAERIALALVEGDWDLANRILLAERDPEFSVEPVADKLVLLRSHGWTVTLFGRPSLPPPTPKLRALLAQLAVQPLLDAEPEPPIVCYEYDENCRLVDVWRD